MTHNKSQEKERAMGRKSSDRKLRVHWCRVTGFISQLDDECYVRYDDGISREDFYIRFWPVPFKCQLNFGLCPIDNNF